MNTYKKYNETYINEKSDGFYLENTYLNFMADLWCVSFNTFFESLIPCQ